MDNIFIIGGALLAAHMLTRGGGNGVSELFSGGGGGGMVTGAGRYQSEENIDADAYMREIRDERSYENQGNTIGDFFSSLFDGGLFAQGTAELSSDEDRGVKVDVIVEAPIIEIEHSTESTNDGSGPIIEADGPPEPIVYELPKTFSKELIERTGVQAVRVDYDEIEKEFDFQPSQTKEAYESFSFAKPIHIAESNFFENPVTIQGERDLGIPGGPVQGWETLAAFKGGFDTVTAYRNAQDN